MPIREDLYRKMMDEREPSRTWHAAPTAAGGSWCSASAFSGSSPGGARVVFAFHTRMDENDALEIVWGGFAVAAAGTALTVALGAPRGAREE